MAAMKTIYSVLPSATRFHFPPEDCYITIEGTNSNQIKTHALNPRKNEVADYHWKYIQDKYANGKYPHLFGGIGGDAIYEAPTETKATNRMLESEPARTPDTIVAADPKIKKYDKNDDL